MKFTTHNDGPIAPFVTTSFVGTIQARLSELAFAFGSPEDIDDDYCEHMTMRWTLKFEDSGLVATIYDWSRGRCRAGEPYAWHIGGPIGRGHEAVHRVHQAFREAHRRLQDGHRRAAA
jgi:hypothetical protein